MTIEGRNSDSLECFSSFFSSSSFVHSRIYNQYEWETSIGKVLSEEGPEWKGFGAFSLSFYYGFLPSAMSALCSTREGGLYFPRFC